MSEMLQPKRKTLDKILSLIVLAVSVFIAVGCSAYTNAIAPEIAKNMYALPVEGFAWWRVLVCAIVLGGHGICSFEPKEHRGHMVEHGFHCAVWLHRTGAWHTSAHGLLLHL